MAKMVFWILMVVAGVSALFGLVVFCNRHNGSAVATAKESEEKSAEVRTSTPLLYRDQPPPGSANPAISLPYMIEQRYRSGLY